MVSALVRYNFAYEKSIFDMLPPEILIMTAMECDPLSLYNMTIASKRFRDLIIPNINEYVKYYAKIAPLEIERYIWPYFLNNTIRIDKFENNLLSKISEIYNFANSKILEQVWEENNMIYITSLGPLPENPLELHTMKILAGLMIAFYNMDVLHASELVYHFDYTYAPDEDILKFLLHLSGKYPELVSIHFSNIYAHIEAFLDLNMNCEWVDDYMEEAMSYGANPEDVFDILIDEDYIDEYMRLLTYGVEPDHAKDDVHNDEYSDEQLGVYNCIRHIIGNDLAHHYILDNDLDINYYPNFLSNVVKIRSLEIYDVNIINKFLNNPTELCLDTMKLQLDIFGTIDQDLVY